MQDSAEVERKFFCFFFAEKEPKQRVWTPTSEVMLLPLVQNILNGKVPIAALPLNILFGLFS